ncbi:dTDP-4-dehydrorhamnose reductase [Leptospira sp. 96542]|nr:dTDP-4-dehydrorhamnose reductase [Leptospira sp. 96542]
MRKILVIGSTGQLGNELKVISELNKNYQFEFLERNQLDLSSASGVDNYFLQNNHTNIHAIINAAAYTAVDKAENDFQNAYQINVMSVKKMANFAKSIGAKFIHVSTDFVFDGKSSHPYSEDDKKNPISVYGKTKSEGEDLVIATDPNFLVIRTSWVYSRFGKNFFNTIIRLARERSELGIVDDQIGTPTLAYDLAQVCLEGAVSEKSGIFHFSNEGVASWYDFASEIVCSFGFDCNVKPISTEDYPTDAKRPAYSVLSKKKFRNGFAYKNLHWKERLRSLVTEIKSNSI